MFDSMGRKVLERAVYTQEELNISSFKSGMYYVHFYNEEGYTVGLEKLMKL